jgi:hypothetical protein
MHLDGPEIDTCSSERASAMAFSLAQNPFSDDEYFSLHETERQLHSLLSIDG